MAERKVYRGHRGRAFLAMTVGAFFSIFGVFGLNAIGWESWYFSGIFSVLGGFGFVLGCDLLAQRVVVDGAGITRLFWFGMHESRIAWEGVEAWLVSSNDDAPEQRILAHYHAEAAPFRKPIPLNTEDSFTPHVATFRLRRRSWPIIIYIVIYDVDACRPGFDAFLEDVRAHVGDREIVITGPPVSTTKARTRDNAI